MKFKLLAVVLGAAAIFFAGYQYAAALYEKDAAELREAEAVARADMGRKQYAKMVEALDALAGLRGELADARADADLKVVESPHESSLEMSFPIKIP